MEGLNMSNLEKVTADNFNEVAYILANPDVGVAMMNGELVSAWVHFASIGHKEGRQQLVATFSQRQLDSRYLANDVPLSGIARHSNHCALIESLCTDGASILEVGSRRVTSDSLWLRKTTRSVGARYVGFDYYAGSNVDVVGDAHRLSSYFSEQFDVVYSSAVFKHLAMP